MSARITNRMALGCAAAIAAALLAGCDSYGLGPQRGAVTAQVTWPGIVPPLTGAVETEPGIHHAAPANVTTMRATISADDIADPVTQDFDATPGVDGSGVVDGIPVGDDRTLTLQGLDSLGNVLYEAVTEGIKVEGGEAASAGTLEMVFVQRLMVYVLNRDVNPDPCTISAFSVNLDDGTLTAVGTPVTCEQSEGTHNAQVMTADPGGRFLYVLSSYTAVTPQGEWDVYAIDPDDGSLAAGTTAFNADYSFGAFGVKAVINPDGTALYWEVSTGADPGIAFVSVDAVDGTMTQDVAGSISSDVGGSNLGGMAVLPSGDDLIVAGGDGVGGFVYAVLAIGSNGALGTADTTDLANGGNISDTALSPDGSLLVMSRPNAGLGELYKYAVDGNGAISGEAGSGTFSGIQEPRALVFHPSGSYAISGAGASSDGVQISSYAIPSGSTFATPDEATVPGATPESVPDIAIDPSGRYVYALGSMDTQLYLFTVDENGNVDETADSVNTGDTPITVIVVGLPNP